ncbi:MAG: LacI family DNA-binding transcriptional regulator [bacterium]
MQDVAKACGVSKNTVSQALRNSPQISEATRQRIAKAATRMGYRKNAVVAELMARLHAGGTRRFRCTLALINANTDPKAFHRHPTIPVYVQGCRARAAELGYELDEFWIHEPKIGGQRLSHIFRTRGIPGGIVVGLMDENRLPAHFEAVWKEFPLVVTGVRTREPSLSFACVDHHMLALRAFEKALELGCKRPGLVLDGNIDALVEHRFSAGYEVGQRYLPTARRLKPFFAVSQARADRSLFRNWLKKERPDAIFSLYHEIGDWVEESGLRVPDDVLMIQYEWRPGRPHWPGMNQRNELTGQAAVDMLIGMLHRSEKGPPLFTQATLIDPSWKS